MLQHAPRGVAPAASVANGDFDVIRRSLARLTRDRRIQVLLVAFCFGAPDRRDRGLRRARRDHRGPLQATTAKVSGLDPILTAATTSSGGVMGKMISPQNLSVVAAGVGAVSSEGAIFRRVLVHSLVLTALMGLRAMLQAYVFPWMVPSL